MGQTLDKHDLFLKGLKESLRMRGTRVKKKDLKKLFDFISDVCPWFLQEGTIDKKRWTQIGDCLQDFYKTFGPGKVLVQAFSYWNLINEILTIHKNGQISKRESINSFPDYIITFLPYQNHKV